MKIRHNPAHLIACAEVVSNYNKYFNYYQIYNMIVNDVNNDDSINNILKNKVIDKSNVYRSDISDYIYDLDVNLISDLWLFYL